MGCLYLTQSGTKLGRTGRRLVVTKDDQELASCPVHHIDRVLILGRVQLTADAMALLMARGIPVSLFNSRGQYRGSLEANSENSFHVRRRHYALVADPEYCLAFARRLVAAKILSARAVLQRYQANHLEMKFYSAIQNLLDLSEKTASADTRDAIRGLEGMAARLYFDEWRRIFPSPPLAFPGRVRRPPRDPINAILSYSYTLLVGLLKGLLSAHQLDPWGGFVHSNIRSAPALVLDMVEEFRHPVADRFVFYCLHKRILAAGDFETLLNGAVTLTQKAHKKFITRWEQWLHLAQRWKRKAPQISAMELMHQQIDRLADAVTHGKTYLPFVLEA